ncbi:MAG: succinylarginine dihydrolase [Candidatus Marinamargulisbacteria bacterium]|jgi:succinylarginine dihydrolase
MTRLFEVNVDSLIGPTHHFGGLAYGDLASMAHSGERSNPRKAAIQGLEKMKRVWALGVGQLILPPHRRPDFLALSAAGFSGQKEAVLSAAYKKDPYLLSVCSSSSFMWMANAALVTPVTDGRKGCLDITPANLVTHAHRRLESEQTKKLLRGVFDGVPDVCVHDAISHEYPDEGAANHIRFSGPDRDVGVHLFVFGGPMSSDSPGDFPIRQSQEAVDYLVDRHGLEKSAVVMACQNDEVVQEGVFHNDVISTGHRNFFLCHERAFDGTATVISQISQKLEARCGVPLIDVMISDAEFPVSDAVASYFFNSQIVTREDGSFVMLLPEKCRDFPKVPDLLRKIEAKDPRFSDFQFIDLSESMNNGGGPACLRLRMPVTSTQFDQIPSQFKFDDDRFHKLVELVSKVYPEQMSVSDLADPRIFAQVEASHEALDTCFGLELGSKI